eukprot:CAMPEP_0115629222 /NCGR_PEP_ID=MMETSP0272-20121206/29822_1 /TAXON_ID=71861 /ORGANISM="Scrippsiella trochoidea, Strain CCMP3099" /LENGTH=52 /DNA_ID=CAMNT_0003065749 /DNA_START=100 /DNA_END=255 /DNA_ORIENTATION=+
MTIGVLSSLGKVKVPLVMVAAILSPTFSFWMYFVDVPVFKPPFDGHWLMTTV